MKSKLTIIFIFSFVISLHSISAYAACSKKLWRKGQRYSREAGQMQIDAYQKAKKIYDNFIYHEYSKDSSIDSILALIKKNNQELMKHRKTISHAQEKNSKAANIWNKLSSRCKGDNKARAKQNHRTNINAILALSRTSTKIDDFLDKLYKFKFPAFSLKKLQNLYNNHLDILQGNSFCSLKQSIYKLKTGNRDDYKEVIELADSRYDKALEIFYSVSDDLPKKLETISTLCFNEYYGLDGNHYVQQCQNIIDNSYSTLKSIEENAVECQTELLSIKKEASDLLNAPKEDKNEIRRKKSGKNVKKLLKNFNTHYEKVGLNLLNDNSYCTLEDVEDKLRMFNKKDCEEVIKITISRIYKLTEMSGLLKTIHYMKSNLIPICKKHRDYYSIALLGSGDRTDKIGNKCLEELDLFEIKQDQDKEDIHNCKKELESVNKRALDLLNYYDHK